MQSLWIGTSGWSYKGWAKTFYPDKTGKGKEFAFYSSQFPTVELNASFYRTPTEKTVKGWNEKSPPGFIFAVKGSRYVTHIKRLKDVEESVPWFCKRMSDLKQHLGPFLWQLPPSFKKDLHRLEQFLRILPKEYRHAIEFRHPSWLEDDTFETLSRYEVCHVSVSSMRMPMDFTLTTDFSYIRFHGLQGGPAHDYTREELQPWAEHMQRVLDHGMSVYAYFNNDVNTRAPDNARMLKEMVEDHASHEMMAGHAVGEDAY